MALAVQYAGAEIQTVEGLAGDGVLHPLQQAFLEHDGFQCAYCTPGQICSAIGMLDEFRKGLPSAVTANVSSEVTELTDEEIGERMSGNLCRCGAYVWIRAAIRQAFQAELQR
jgi:xanthine dehydrogenase YagT iron-sulfur-binding subunit